MPKILDIIKYPTPSLRDKSVEIPLSDIKKSEMKQLLLDMEHTMKELDGAGLAAPQIGLNIRLVVMHDEKANRTIFMINPKITKKSWGQEIDEEGCLSVLDDQGKIIYGRVSRHKKVTCNYYDENGDKKKIQADRMLSRIIQHETDHLEGILFIDLLVK
ncbi:MAG: peptide deformylase [Candidatus Falkowbacteria bacterium]